MKICPKCSAYNSDDRIFCVDCNEKLGKKLSAVDEQEKFADVNEKMEEMYNKKDPLYVSGFDKVMGITSLAGLLCSVILLVIGGITQRSFDLLWIGIILFVLSSIEALVPKVTWAIEKIRLSFYINSSEDAEPSDFYRLCRKATILILVVVGIIILAVHCLDFRHAPVRKYISDIASAENTGLSSHTKDYINANPEKWEKILSEKDYAVDVFISELEKADNTGIEERLMMDAITEISGKDDLNYTTKDDFLFFYNTYDWEQNS